MYNKHLSLTAQAVSNLVEVSEDQPVTTSVAISDALNRPHNGVIQLVRQHEESLKVFGLVKFEIAPRQCNVHGGGAISFAILNEQQATLLISFMSNTPKVVDFKIRLVKAFYEMRKKLEQERKALVLPNIRHAGDIIDFVHDNYPEVDSEIRRDALAREQRRNKDFEHVAHSMYALREAADRIEEMYKQMNEVKKCMRLAEDAMIKMNSIKGSIFDMVDIARQELGQVADAHPEIDELVSIKMMP